MGTIYEVMQHNYTHGVQEKGVATLLHPLCPCPGEQPTAYALQFHQTDVVVAYPDGSVKLNSGGYSQPHYAWSRTTKTVSPTTQERINRYMPAGYRLYQHKNKWWVSMPNGNTVEFTDGMVLGSVTGALQPYCVDNEQFSYN